MTFEPRAHQDRELRGFFIKLVPQAHEAQHLTRYFVERDEGHLVAVVEMTEPVARSLGSFRQFDCYKT